MIVLPQTWSIGERKFGGEFKIRIMMYESIVKSIMMYGAEVWGWQEEEELERVQAKYFKWMLGLDINTPSYIVLEETKSKKIKIEAAKRAMKFEEKIRKHPEKEILYECWREMEKREEQGKTPSRWELKRKKTYEHNGYSTQEIRTKRNRGQDITEEVVQRMKDIEDQEQQNKITNSRYNNKYKKTWTTTKPRYMTEKGSKEKKKIIARFRCGNEERVNNFWLDEEKKLCRMCWEGRETVEHLLGECDEVRSRGGSREEILDESGTGYIWMKEIRERREEIEKNRKKINI